MPIQFRCGSCQQLLGIARRKAGAIVDCPTCRQKTRVPFVKENVAPPPPTKAAVNQPVSIFDKVDVEKLLSHGGHPPVVKVTPARVHAGEIELPSLLQPSDPLREPEPVAEKLSPEDDASDAPFTLTSAAVHPALDWSRNKTRFYWGLGGVLVFAGIFVLGHWIGAHHPWF